MGKTDTEVYSTVRTTLRGLQCPLVVQGSSRNSGQLKELREGPKAFENLSVHLAS